MSCGRHGVRDRYVGGSMAATTAWGCGSYGEIARWDHLSCIGSGVWAPNSRCGGSSPAAQRSRRATVPSFPRQPAARWVSRLGGVRKVMCTALRCTRHIGRGSFE